MAFVIYQSKLQARDYNLNNAIKPQSICKLKTAFVPFSFNFPFYACRLRQAIQPLTVRIAQYTIRAYYCLQPTGTNIYRIYRIAILWQNVSSSAIWKNCYNVYNINAYKNRFCSVQMFFFFIRFHLISISEGYNGKATKQPIHRLNVEKKKKRMEYFCWRRK